MLKIFTFFIAAICLSLTAKADHISGGTFYYTFVSSMNGTNTYHVTFQLYSRCESTSELNNPTIISVFDRGTSTRITDLAVNIRSRDVQRLTNPDPCMTNPPDVCYQIAYYTFDLSLPVSTNGYILATQANYRVDSISNLYQCCAEAGATYTAEIPGTAYSANNSARFIGNDLIAICAGNKFSYSFAATDLDGDTLRYSFCRAYNSSVGGGGGGVAVAPLEPPYWSVLYGNGFTETTPLGSEINIDQKTGLITGKAPARGSYIIAVCVEEIRGGVVIATQRKDLQIHVASCEIVSATLEPEYSLCKEKRTIQIFNLSKSPLIRSWYWELINNTGSVISHSAIDTFNYNFIDTGTYQIKLWVNRGTKCEDSTSSVIRVYPGLTAGFNYSGSCYKNPFQFTDATSTVNSTISSWSWTFGTVDTSHQQNPDYTFTSGGVRNVELVVTNTFGCSDTVAKMVTVITSPPLTLAFKDTLICTSDKVTLHAIGTGNFTWTPATYIDNAFTATPVVSPATTTTYIVNLNADGCINRDSVKVRVTDHVELKVMADTAICLGDTLHLQTQSDALHYSWSPSLEVSNPNSPNPLVVPVSSATFTVTANIGSCSKTGTINVRTVPYPIVSAGADTVICYNTYAVLHGESRANFFSWSPSTALSTSGILNPVAMPALTTMFMLTVSDTSGCPKTASDTMIVKVLPPVVAFTGNDTSVVVEQPLQLQANGGTIYSWYPETGLSSAHIANPVAVYSQPSNGILYRVIVSNEARCSDSAFVTVKIFSAASVFVPSAFTPNGDGKNDWLRPIAAGMKQVDYFNIYNRWGQLLYTNKAFSKGWDGTINGIQQPAGAYVWMVKATDYKGAPYFKKGTVMLIK